MKGTAAALGLASFFSPTYATKVPLILLSETEYPTAKCLDGTQAGYYYQSATKSEENKKWVGYSF